MTTIPYHFRAYHNIVVILCRPSQNTALDFDEHQTVIEKIRRRQSNEEILV